MGALGGRELKIGDDLLRAWRAWLACFCKFTVPTLGAKLPNYKLAPVGFDWHKWMRNCSWISYLNPLPTPAFFHLPFLQRRIVTTSCKASCSATVTHLIHSQAVPCTHALSAKVFHSRQPHCRCRKPSHLKLKHQHKHIPRASHTTLCSSIAALLDVQFSFGHPFSIIAER